MLHIKNTPNDLMNILILYIVTRRFMLPFGMTTQMPFRVSGVATEQGADVNTQIWCVCIHSAGDRVSARTGSGLGSGFVQKQFRTGFRFGSEGSARNLPWIPGAPDDEAQRATENEKQASGNSQKNKINWN